MAVESDLGVVTGTYRTDTRRRSRVAVVLLVFGVLVTVAGVAYWLVVEDRMGKVRMPGDPLMLPSAVIGLGVGALLCGIVTGIWCLTRRDEVFQLHENGLKHSYADRVRLFTWADVERVIVRPGKDNAVAMWAGGDVNCTVRFTGGAKVNITGFTRDAEQLVQRIEAATKR